MQSPLAKLKAIEMSAQTQIANKKQFADEMKWQLQVNAIKRERRGDIEEYICMYVCMYECTECKTLVYLCSG